MFWSKNDKKCSTDHIKSIKTFWNLDQNSFLSNCLTSLGRGKCILDPLKATIQYSTLKLVHNSVTTVENGLFLNWGKRLCMRKRFTRPPSPPGFWILQDPVPDHRGEPAVPPGPAPKPPWYPAGGVRQAAWRSREGHARDLRPQQNHGGLPALHLHD